MTELRAAPGTSADGPGRRVRRRAPPGSIGISWRTCSSRGGPPSGSGTSSARAASPRSPRSPARRPRSSAWSAALDLAPTGSCPTTGSSRHRRARRRVHGAARRLLAGPSRRRPHPRRRALPPGADLPGYPGAPRRRDRLGSEAAGRARGGVHVHRRRRHVGGRLLRGHQPRRGAARPAARGVHQQRVGDLDPDQQPDRGEPRSRPRARRPACRASASTATTCSRWSTPRAHARAARGCGRGADVARAGHLPDGRAHQLRRPHALRARRRARASGRTRDPIERFRAALRSRRLGRRPPPGARRRGRGPARAHHRRRASNTRSTRTTRSTTSPRGQSPARARARRAARRDRRPTAPTTPTDDDGDISWRA